VRATQRRSSVVLARDSWRAVIEQGSAGAPSVQDIYRKWRLVQTHSWKALAGQGKNKAK
jgi:hypothetical protein